MVGHFFFKLSRVIILIMIFMYNFFFNFSGSSVDSIPLNATNILCHAMNSVIMFLDILIVAYPLRLYHVIQPIW